MTHPRTPRVQNRITGNQIQLLMRNSTFFTTDGTSNADIYFFGEKNNEDECNPTSVNATARLALRET